MTDEYTPKRIFEVARILKISTPDIIDYLADLGHDVTRKQMQPVTEKMYIALLHKFDRGHFEKYLIDHGVIGEELRRLTSMLEEERKKALKPVEIPKKVEPVRAINTRSTRKIRLPAEKSETIKVTFFRREKPVPAPEPAKVTYAIPSSLFARIDEHPKPIPTSPLVLELIQRILALPMDRKQTLISQLRQRDPR
jgi:hypothetical protein